MSTTAHKGVRATITAELAVVVGQIAKRHPEAAIEIVWRNGQPEQHWLVLAHVYRPDIDFYGYLVNDEDGTYVNASDETMREYLGDDLESVG